MTLVEQVSTSLAKTVVRPSGQKQMGHEMGQEDPSSVTIGMLLPLLWSGRAARCGDHPRLLRGTERCSTG
jgi:hypothetical protein